MNTKSGLHRSLHPEGRGDLNSSGPPPGGAASLRASWLIYLHRNNKSKGKKKHPHTQSLSTHSPYRYTCLTDVPADLRGFYNNGFDEHEFIRFCYTTNCWCLWRVVNVSPSFSKKCWCVCQIYNCISIQGFIDEYTFTQNVLVHDLYGADDHLVSNALNDSLGPWMHHLVQMFPFHFFFLLKNSLNLTDAVWVWHLINYCLIKWWLSGVLCCQDCDSVVSKPSHWLLLSALKLTSRKMYVNQLKVSSNISLDASTELKKKIKLASFATGEPRYNQ